MTLTEKPVEIQKWALKATKSFFQL